MSSFKVKIPIFVFIFVYHVLLGFIENADSWCINCLPVKVEVINRWQAKYDSPENAYIASYSSERKKDLEWTFETMTVEAAEELKKIFNDLKIPLDRIVNYEQSQEETFIVDKINHRYAVVLIIEHISMNGSIQRTPVTFMMEKGNWKLTNSLSADEFVNSYLAFYKRECLDQKNQIDVFYSNIDYNRLSNQFYVSVKLKNISNHVFYGPVWFKVRNIQPEVASLMNADGMHFDEPYIILLNETKKWDPKALLQTTLYFSNSAGPKLHFNENVFAVTPEDGF